MAKDDELFIAGNVSSDATPSGGMTANEIGVLDAVDVPIIVISREYKIARINRAAMTVFGLKVSDIGCSLGNTLAGVEDLNRICRRVISDGAPHRIETRDGDRRFLLRIAPYTGSKRSAETALTTHFGSEASSRIQGPGSGDYFLGKYCWLMGLTSSVRIPSVNALAIARSRRVSS